MNTHVKTFPDLIYLVAIILVPLSTLFYAVSVINGVPLADEWRWLKNLLIPYIEGRIGFWDYLTGEYSFLGHTHFFTLLFLLVNFKLFNLDFSLFAYFGLVFYVLGWFVLLVYMYRVGSRSRGYALAAAVLTLGYFSPTSDFPWLLVSFEYFYYFFALVFLICFDLCLRGRISFLNLYLGAVIASVFLDSFGAVAILTCIFILILKGIKSRSYFIQAFVVFFVYSISWLIMRIMLGDGVLTASSSRIHALIALYKDPVDIIASLLISFSQPLVDKAVVYYYFGPAYRAAQFAIGLFGFLFVSSALFFFRRSGQGFRTDLPYILFVYALISWFLILTTRYSDFGVGVFDAQRFTRFFALYYVAAGFSLIGSNFSTRTGLVIALPLIFLYCISLTYQVNYRAGVVQYFKGASMELKSHRIDGNQLAKYIGQCGNSYCDDIIVDLRKRDVLFVSVDK